MTGGSEKRKGGISELVGGMAGHFLSDRTTIGEIVDVFAEKGFAFAILMLALPTTIPIVPPGLSAISGFPIAFLAVQLMLGLSRPWLPKWLRDKSVPTSELLKLFAKTLPALKRFERISRPRLLWASNWLQKAVGLLLVFLGLLLASPLPFTNMILSFAIILLCIGLFENDGIIVIVAIIIGIISIYLLAYLVDVSFTSFIDWLWPA